MVITQKVRYGIGDLRAAYLGCGARLFLELHNAKVKTVQDLGSTADLIGTNEAAALAFQEIQISSLAQDTVPAR